MALWLGATLLAHARSSVEGRATEAGTRPGAPSLPQALDPLIRTYPKPIAAALKGLEQGIEKYAAGAYGAALAALPGEPAAAATAVGDLVVLYRGKANLALDRPAEALREFRDCKTRFPRSPELREATLGEVEAHLRLRDPAAALAALANPGLEEDAETVYFRGRAQEDAGDAAAAKVLYLRVYSEFGASKTAAQAEQRLLSLEAAFAADPANYSALLRRAQVLVAAGRNSDARALLTRPASERLRAMPRPKSATCCSPKRSAIWAARGWLCRSSPR